ncbi:MAG TPA: DUF1501 domain-containing protein [Verrucomicrobiae bacterium]
MRSNRNFSRRDFLWRTGGGFGALALSQLLSSTGGAPQVSGRKVGAQFAPKAKRVIQLFMNGGVSQMDTFDYKPSLEKLHDQKFDPGSAVEAATSVPGKLMKSPFDFKQHGECGRWVSSAFPHIARCVDDLAFLMGMSSKTNVHGPGSYMMNTGFLLPGFPCLGAWVSYGLGNLTDNLPTFVVLPDGKGLPYNQKGNFSAGFLPVQHQGTIINATAPQPIHDLVAPENSFISAKSEKESLHLLQKLNRSHAQSWPGEALLDARIASYELAARLQLSAPEALELKGESEATRKLYGADEEPTRDFGTRCLLARRLIERGVRFVQVWSGAGGPKNNWDNHQNIAKELPPMAAATDKPIAGLLMDLKARGLLEDTIVIWTTEFGRMPFTQEGTGRDHNGGTFVTWLAGAGIKGGSSYGSSDEWSWKAAEGQTYCYDLHATILHLLGIDHEKLTFRFNGTDRRLTDVHGEVIHPILA